MLEEEEPSPAAEKVTVVVPPIAQTFISRNPCTFVGVPKDPGLEYLAYLSFRAALESGFNFYPNLSINQNKKRVQKWRNKIVTQISAPFP